MHLSLIPLTVYCVVAAVLATHGPQQFNTSSNAGNYGGDSSDISTRDACTVYGGPKPGYATTTHYYDGTEGACGCGSGGAMAPWQANPGNGFYTAAVSPGLFGGGSWCGIGCGTCFQLTNTGATAAEGTGDCTGRHETIIVMVTNLCPVTGNEQWCSVPNAYGFDAHFDIMSPGPPNGWNNPVVRYGQIACPDSLTAQWGTCQCAGGATSRVRRSLMGDSF